MALRLLVLALSCVLSLAAVEGALRLLGLPRTATSPEGPGADSAWRNLLHRPSAIPGLAYELNPGVERAAQGTLVRVNDHGMRDAEPLAGDEVLRIAVLGDSYTFGFFVAQEQTYAAVLERLLEASAAPRRVDVLNFGVGGYSTRDEALVLEHRALPFDPDAVIVGYALNDPEIDPVQPLHRHFHESRGWERLHLFHLARAALDGLRTRGLGPEPSYVRSLHENPRKWAGVERALRRIHALAAERSLPALLVVFPTRPRTAEGRAIVDWAEYPYRDLHERVTRLGRQIGLHTLDLLPHFERHPVGEVMGRHIHPTARGHEVAARALHERLRALGLPPDRAQRPGRAAFPPSASGALSVSSSR